MSGNFHNSKRLVYFNLRRERIISTIWIVGLTLFSVILTFGMGNMFDNEARQALAITLDNPGIVSMMGPIYGSENFTEGAMYTVCMLLWVALTVGAMNIFLVVRHTRADEETGRAELIKSLPVGRMATLNSTMITAVIVNVILGLLHCFGIWAVGVESMDFTGSMIYGFSLTAIGLLFASITAVFCQLSSSSRGAVAYSFVAMGVMYILRAVGDMGSETLSLISPLGLLLRSKAFIDNNFLPPIILLLEAAVITVIGYKLNSIRDFGQGFIPAKSGRKDASKTLLSPIGLSLRLLRTPLIIWVIVMFGIGLAYGSVLGDIQTFVDSSELYRNLIGTSDEFSVAIMFTSMISTISSLICLIPMFMVVLKLRSEEKSGRLENVLTLGVSRIKYFGGYAVIACIACVFMQFATTLGLYISGAATLSEPIAFDFLLKSSFVYIPALWVMIGFAVLVTGVIPKLTNIVWAYFGYSFFSAFMGRILDLPDWVYKLSPFGFIPQLPVDEINYVTLATLTVVAVVLTSVGLVFYRRRDMVI